MKTLYRRIYFTFVAGLFISAIAAGILTAILLGTRFAILEAHVGNLAHHLAAVVSQEHGHATVSAEATAKVLGLDLTIFDGEDRRLMGEESLPPSDVRERVRRGERVTGRSPLVAYAPWGPDDRGIVIVTQRVRVPTTPAMRGVVWLVAFFAGMALLTRPVARGMSRRLEKLKRGADALAEGKLDTRVEVEGRDEIAALATAMNGMAAQLQQLIRNRKELTAAVSHELRSPLARLKISLEMAAEPGIETGRRERHLNEVASDIEELESLIDTLLLSSRLELADFPLNPEEFEVSGLIQEIGRRYDRVRVEGDAGSVVADRRLLARAIVNLVENALRASEPETPVDLRVASADSGVVIEVIDQGPGVPLQDRERIFEPFQRVDASRSRESGGVGLGLAIACRIAQRHGGKLTLEPSDVGARFRLTVPRSPATAQGRVEVR